MKYKRPRTLKEGFIFGLAPPVLLLLLALGGCATAPHPASISRGECRVFEAPQYVVQGKHQYDQNWIDSTVEGGIGACGWQRPAPRPAESKKAAAPVTAKPKAWLRFLHGLQHTPAAEFEPPPPAPPRRPIDELLGTVQ